MATRIETFPLVRFPVPPRIRHLSAIVRLLPLLSIFLSAVSLASAQTSQQHVYGSASAAANSPTSVVAAFSKTSQTGALTLVPGSPFSDRLEGGLMAIDGQGKFLFVLNPTSNDISMFQIDQTSGALSEVPASPFAVPTDFGSGPPPSQPLSITAERSGKFLFVGYLFDSGSQGPSSVASLAINTSGPSPVLVTVQSILTNTGGSPIQLLTDSKGLHLYVGLGISSSGMLVGGAECIPSTPQPAICPSKVWLTVSSHLDVNMRSIPEIVFSLREAAARTSYKVALSHRWMGPRIHAHRSST